MQTKSKETEFPKINIEDPLYRFFTQQLGMRLIHLMSVLFGVNIIRSLLFPYLRHQQFSQSSGLFITPGQKDIQAMIASFIVQPILLYVYWRTVEVIPQIYKKLCDNHVIVSKGTKTVTEFAQDIETKMTSKFAIIFLFSCVLGLLITFHILVWPGTLNNNEPIGAYPYYWWDQAFMETFHGFVIYSFVFWSFWRIFVFAQSTLKLWQNFNIRININHQDGAGGLRPIGEFTRYIGMYVSSLILFTFASIWGNQDREQVINLAIVMGIIILAVAPIAFLLPVWSTHKAMLDWRKSKIEILNIKIISQWHKLHKYEFEITEEEVHNLSSTIELTKLNKKIIPVWPFRTMTIIRYSVRLIVPLLMPEVVSLLFSTIFGSSGSTP